MKTLYGLCLLFQLAHGDDSALLPFQPFKASYSLGFRWVFERLALRLRDD